MRIFSLYHYIDTCSEPIQCAGIFSPKIRWSQHDDNHSPLHSSEYQLAELTVTATMVIKQTSRIPIEKSTEKFYQHCL